MATPNMRMRVATWIVEHFVLETGTVVSWHTCSVMMSVMIHDKWFTAF